MLLAIDAGNTQTVVGLGLHLRSEAKIRVRQPLKSLTYALAPSDTAGVVRDIIAEELNVKDVIETKDATNLAKKTVQVDARKAGPRLGAKVQEIIKAAKAGQFEEREGKIILLGEQLTPDEAKVVYTTAEGKNISSDRGCVVSLDTTVTDELRLEGCARELIRAIQALRKNAGLEFTDTITLHLKGADDVLAAHGDLLLRETRSILGENAGREEKIDLEGRKVTVRLEKHAE